LINWNRTVGGGAFGPADIIEFIYIDTNRQSVPDLNG
jgi:hypothetical protein